MRAHFDLRRHLALLGLCILAIAHFAQLQPRHTVRGGVAWDGIIYYRLAEQVCAGKALAGQRPFSLRIGQPALACALTRVTGLNLKDAFFALGLICSLASVWLLDRWLRDNGARPTTVWLFCALYVLGGGALRGTFYDPISTGGITQLFLLLGWLVLQRGGLAPMLAFTLVAVPVREFMLVYPLLYLVFGNGNAERTPSALVKRALPLVVGVLVLIALLTKIEVISARDFLTNKPYSFVDHALVTLYEQTFVRFLYSACLAFGPLLWLCVYGFRICGRELRAQPAWAGFVLVIIALAFVGGTDTDRFLSWAFPIVSLLCCKVWDEVDIPVALRATTVALVLLAGRVFWTTPYRFAPRINLCLERAPCSGHALSPTPFLSFWTDDFQIHDLHPYWGTRHFILLVLAQYIACIALLVLVQRGLTLRASRKAKASRG